MATENTETWHTLYIVNEILAPKLFSTQKQKQGTIVAKASDGQRYPMPKVSVGLSSMVKREAARKGLLTYIFVDLALGEGPWP